MKFCIPVNFRNPSWASLPPFFWQSPPVTSRALSRSATPTAKRCINQIMKIPNAVVSFLQIFLQTNPRKETQWYFLHLNTYIGGSLTHGANSALILSVIRWIVFVSMCMRTQVLQINRNVNIKQQDILNKFFTDHWAQNCGANSKANRESYPTCATEISILEWMKNDHARVILVLGMLQTFIRARHLFM